jgi:multidrug efflux pump subunit AcrA (membrane-fusion protein)
MSTPAPDRSLFSSVAKFVAFVLVGVGVYAWLQYTRAAPRTRPAQEQGRPVRTVALEPLEVVPRTTGYGAVEAQREWQALAEVSGTVVEVADRLEVGRVVQAGTVLLKIDPANVAIEQGRTEAAVKAVRAQIGELKAREASAQQNLAIDERSLALARSELERVRELYEQGAAPLTDVEVAERAVISAEKIVQGHRNTLAELPATRRVLEAQLEQQQAGVETSKITLAKTELVAPFTMRLREVNVALQQTVTGGQVLLVGDGIDVFEVPAQVPVGAIGQLLPPRDPQAEAAREPGAPRPPRTAAIEAIVRLDAQGVTRTWKGRYRRSGGIDPNTRMMLAVVEVEDVRDEAARAGMRLQRGLYVEVELRGPPRRDCLAVPRGAYHDGKLYVAGEGDRLELRSVEASLVQEEFVCVAGDVKAGDRVVTTDLVPALPGMLLAPRGDDEGREALVRAARGDAP